MNIIHYFVKEFTKDKEPQIVPKIYKTKDKEFEYWLDVIKKTYGKYGKITYEDVEDVKAKEEIRANALSYLIIESKKKDIIISDMAKQINNLNIKLNKIEGEKNV